MNNIPDLTIADFLAGCNTTHVSLKSLKGRWLRSYPSRDFEEAFSYSRENFEIIEITKLAIYKSFYPESLKNEKLKRHLQSFNDKKVIIHYKFNEFVEECLSEMLHYHSQYNKDPLLPYLFIKGE
jgi:hypothetical protein